MESQPIANNMTMGTSVPGTPATAAKSSGGGQFDIKLYLGALLGNWYWILISILVALFCAVIYLEIAQPVYSIRAAILVNEESNSGSEILDKLNIVKKEPVDFFNEMNTLRSEELVGQTVDSMQLFISYFLRGNLHDKELYKDCPVRIVFDSMGYRGTYTEFSVKYITDGHFDLREGDKITDVMDDSWITRPYGRFKIEYTYNATTANKNYLLSEIIVRIKKPEYAVRSVLDNFNVTSDDGRTSMLDLSYKDNIPERGVDFLNYLIRIYYRDKLANINLAAERTRDFINSHKDELAQSLASVDSSVESIKIESGMSLEPGGGGSAIVTQQTVTRKTLDDLYTKRKSLINLRNLLLNSKYQIIVPLGLDDGILIGLVNQYNTLVQRLETQEKVQELGTYNPFLVQTLVELDNLKKRMLEVLGRISDEVNSDIEVTTKTETSVADKAKLMPNIDRKITEVKRGYDVLQNMYLFLYQKGIENEISVYNEANKSKVMVAPFAASLPISPIKNNIYAIAFLLGLLLPLLVMFVRQMLNKYILNEKDIKAITNIPIVGAISKVTEEEMRNNVIAVSPSVRTGIAEQFRMVRANMEFVPFENDQRIINIISSDSGEGKTFISLNIGIIMALSTKRVVIVELDLRKPRLASILNISNTNGVSEYLDGDIGIKDMLKPSGIHSNLYIANCGQVPPNPGDLLAYPSMKQMLQELQDMFDVVIVDTAPISMVSDALMISQYVGVNMCVVRQNYTTKKQVGELDQLHKVGKIHNPLIIFNSVEYLTKFGYYANPNRDYEEQLMELTTPKRKKGLLSFIKK